MLLSYIKELRRREMTIDINDFAECTFWAVECLECQEMIELSEPPTKGEDILCSYCESSYLIN